MANLFARVMPIYIRSDRIRARYAPLSGNILHKQQPSCDNKAQGVAHARVGASKLTSCVTVNSSQPRFEINIATYGVRFFERGTDCSPDILKVSPLTWFYPGTEALEVFKFLERTSACKMQTHRDHDVDQAKYNICRWRQRRVDEPHLRPLNQRRGERESRQRD